MKILISNLSKNGAQEKQKQGGFIMIFLVIGIVVLSLAVVSYTQNYEGIKGRSSMNIYQSAQDNLDKIKDTTGLGSANGINGANGSSSDIDVGINVATGTTSTASTTITASSTLTDADTMSVKLFYVSEDASAGEAVNSGKTIVCTNYILVPTDVRIPIIKETIKASITALSSRDYNPEGMEFGPFNFLTADNLLFQSASISSGVATVKLIHNEEYFKIPETDRMGSFNQNVNSNLSTEARDCGIKEQVKNTTLQFKTAKSVKVYVDGVLLK